MIRSDRRVTSRLHLLAKARTNQRPATLSPANGSGVARRLDRHLSPDLTIFSPFLFPKEAVEPGNGTCKEGCNGERNSRERGNDSEGRGGRRGIDTEYI